MTVGIFMLYFFRTRLNETCIANVSLLNSAVTLICYHGFIFSLKISSNFTFLISQGTLSHIWGQGKICFLFQSTLCSFFAFAVLNHFSDCMVFIQNEKHLL